MAGLQFLKLGGSLITDKHQPQSARMRVIQRLAEEIADARRELPNLQLVLGHGSGSFGHVAAQKYGTQLGVRSPKEWEGFVQVWRAASALHRLVIEALGNAGVPALSFPPSACLTTSEGHIQSWDTSPLHMALDAGLVPVLYGDVVFDVQLGGTILSTEDLFVALALQLPPDRLLLAGLEPGVWADYPACTRLLKQLTPQDMTDYISTLQSSSAADVTGGMASKVALGIQLAVRFPSLEVRVFSGEPAGAVYHALLGEPLGTLLTS